ncbi:helix-turn-helix transcriptional regulator [Spiractinospora alimapuensis]|uniref:PadR family transcriptional regulator n=1 Tax=Spiractinospora alimapuensis TaxID=2820884 RepID=UPI001F22337B|nr:PadR family transcriptional regulator [Spiractinospora alimapuensis]QVQ51179.1 helix-turn-helix transcriptional regulator [Spiractinospora alimapuensis]
MTAQHESAHPHVGACGGPGDWNPMRWMMAGERGGGPGGPRGGGRGRFRGWGPPPGPPWGGWGGPRRGGFGGPFGPQRRARRGDVRASILALLAEEPLNGYQIIKNIEHRSNGIWRPSAGSVYPALQQLEDEGLVRATESGGRREFALTDEGRAHVESQPEQYTAPWEVASEDTDSEAMEVHELLGEVAMAAVQVVHAGSTTQAAEAKRILTDARRSLYRVLAEDDPEQDAGDD